MRHFCAVCIATIPGTPHREPFGRDRHLVDLCDACATEHPRSGRYGFGEPDRGGVEDRTSTNGRGYRSGRVNPKGGHQ